MNKKFGSSILFEQFYGSLNTNGHKLIVILFHQVVVKANMTLTSVVVFTTNLFRSKLSSFDRPVP